ncbi:hypothetical protein NPIL_132201 [Nephila pilipes]|uniref:Uncharacterized protein n=1 Tax=Nephila pilipes TaxID=299642 RepID=A0A8X6PA17_NEPPI|nr:hypothetical protein NPIL_132201 [Nephila pilipes]
MERLVTKASFIQFFSLRLKEKTRINWVWSDFTTKFWEDGWDKVSHFRCPLRVSISAFTTTARPRRLDFTILLGGYKEVSPRISFGEWGAAAASPQVSGGWARRRGFRTVSQEQDREGFRREGQNRFQRQRVSQEQASPAFRKWQGILGPPHGSSGGTYTMSEHWASNTALLHLVHKPGPIFEPGYL